MASSLALAVCADTWWNAIWPRIKGKPGILSVPELCLHMAEMWVMVRSCTSVLASFKRTSPGKFCMLMCSVFFLLAMVGRYIPGLLLSYVIMFFLCVVLLCPLAAYHRLWQRVCVRLEPALQWLDFSVKGYMMSKPIDNQCEYHTFVCAVTDDYNNVQRFLSAHFDEAAVAKELALTDSEHSDAEVSYTENGTFNLSRGQTPVTEGSEDLDRHSDPEESFAQDLPDFPSINPDATLMEDDDDPSLGIPSLGAAGLPGPRGATTSAMLDLDTQLDSDQEELDHDLSLDTLNVTSDLTSDLAGILASNMIQAAISGALQPRPAPGSRRQGLPRGPGAPRGSCRKQSSSELDTDLDLDAEDFEMLDQSELNQMDPLGGAGGRGAAPGGQDRNQGSSFFSNLLGKPQ
uniref:RETREG1-3/ARL6IP-like N-terminal reticulon-homology domain-containing protein n=1 Tax=Electrophorus electricus TaxID=8005 RepID=A0A4W4EER6_ELEEL